MSTIQKSELTVISLFSGCGGLDYGFEEAGYFVGFYNDYDRHSCETLRCNGKQGVCEAPIEDISAGEARKIAGLGKESPDVLIGGPPCQPFSKSAYWNNGDTLRLEDPRANTLSHYFRFVEELKPQVFLLENVHGLNYNGKEEGFRFILNRISKINRKCGTNYQPSWSVVNVANYGVPQTRVRFFLVACRTGERFHFPNPTHFPAEQLISSFPSIGGDDYVTTWEAIGEIPDDKTQNLKVGGKWAELLPTIPEGENYLWHTDRKGGLPLFGWRTRYWSFLLKLSKRMPSWTIQAQPGSAIGPFHWANRRLSWQEMAALQTFPKSFRINSPRVEIQRQIGNAVPSLMSEILAREIGKQFFKKDYFSPPHLSIARSQDFPPPEPVRAVSSRFLTMVGDHSAHPGTGKGRSYQNGVALPNFGAKTCH